MHRKIARLPAAAALATGVIAAIMAVPGPQASATSAGAVGGAATGSAGPQLPGLGDLAGKPENSLQTLGSSRVSPDVLPGHIVNMASNLCLGIAADGYAGIWNCTSNPDQDWRTGPADSAGFNTIINGNNKCLGVRSGGDTDGSPVVAWVAAPCQPSNPDQWWFGYGNQIFNNYVYYYDSVIPILLAVSGGSTANGAPVVIWHQVNSADQYWMW